MISVRKINWCIGTLFLLFLIFSASQQCTVKGKVRVKKVTVKSNYGTSLHVAVGKKIKLNTTVKVSPNKAANRKVSYKSSNRKIARVTSYGYVKGLQVGRCKITVTSKKNRRKKARMIVNVVKKVSSIAIEPPKNPLYVGNSAILKTIINPEAGSYDKVIWSTSNKSVATVTSSGKVTGVKPGTAVIKATSVEGSKMSASIRLTVLSTDSICIARTEVLSENTVRVVLDRTYRLNREQFAVAGKKYASGKYSRTFQVIRMRNYDDKTYDLTVNDQYAMEKDSFVQVTIKTLPGNGTKVMETQAISVREWQPREEQWIGVVGDKWNKVVDYSEYACGNITYQVVGTIPGITVKVKNNQVLFSGELTSVLIGGNLTIKATDEMGNVFTRQIFVSIGNDTAIVARGESAVWLSGTEIKEMEMVQTLGGSGKYRYSAIHLPTGMALDEETGLLSGVPASVGEYQIQWTVVDREKENRTCHFTSVIRVVDPKKLVGTVQDEDGKPLEGAVILCENVADGTVYTTESDEAGEYSLFVGEGSYNIHVRKEEKTDCVYKVAVGTGGRQLSFTLSEASQHEEAPTPVFRGEDVN